MAIGFVVGGVFVGLVDGVGLFGLVGDVAVLVCMVLGLLGSIVVGAVLVV